MIHSWKSHIGIVLLAFAVVATGTADPPRFSSHPPNMGEAQLVGDLLALSWTSTKFVSEMVTATKKVGDHQEDYAYTVQKPVAETRVEAVAAGDYLVRNMKGQPVVPAELKKRLGKMAQVLVSNSGIRVDPQYLSMYKPDTLIVYLRPDRPQPPQMFGAPVMPPPAPVPSPSIPPAPTR